MKRILFFLLIVPNVVVAQFTDDFADMDFSTNPTWLGDVQQFVVSSDHQLRLYSSGSDTSILYTQSSLEATEEWRFWVHLAFAPSNNNNVRIYLVSDVEDLKGPLHGYYIRMGENGSDDSIDLIKQDSTTHITIIDGIDAQVAASNNYIRIRVVRNAGGDWQLFADPTGGENFQLQGTATDDSFGSGNYFGIFCKYTSSNAQKMFFDDFYAGPEIVDTIVPKIISSKLILPDRVSVSFSETMDSLSVQNPGSWWMPLDIIPLSIDYQGNLALLQFPNNFLSDTTYSIYVSGLADQAGNLMTDTVIELSWHQNHLHDVVINEIMADPYPPVDLPEFEYIEIYNRSSNPLSLEGWELQVGSTVKSLGNNTLQPDNYLILCSTTAEPELENFGSVMAIPSFPSLTNAGQKITLWDSAGVLMDSVSYSTAFYHNDVKADGGWSLERIDPGHFCNVILNWTASVHPSGGTPGFENSVYASFIDSLAPAVEFWEFVTDQQLMLQFSEALQVGSLLPSNFSFLPETEFSLVLSSDHEILFMFTQTQESPSELLLTMNDVEDLCGNLFSGTLELTYYEPVEEDLLINEIMADPTPSVGLPEVEYLELFNASDYSISLNGMQLMIGNKQKELPELFLDKGAYIVLSAEGGCPFFSAFATCRELLGSSDLSNDGTDLVLISKNGQPIHTVSYDVSWYNDELKSDGGWSLERIDPENCTDDKMNWGASENNFGGTPGYVNSILGTSIDDLAPKVLRVLWIDSTHVTLLFSESIAPSLIVAGDLNIFPGPFSPLSAEAIDDFHQQYLLTFSDPFEVHKIYKLVVPALSDCNGNVSQEDTLLFGWPEAASPSDVLINEILFNPPTGLDDFVEIYNNSDKVIDLEGYSLALFDDDFQSYSSVKELSHEVSLLLMPGQFLVFNENPVDLCEYYPNSNPDACMFPPVDPPSMTNSHGHVRLLSKSLEIIDEMIYDESMHFSLLADNKGVSLERIRYNVPSMQASNWHSAAESYGFASPGLQNSQFSEGSNQSEVLFIEEKTFSPDNDGYQDNLVIGYRFDLPGYIGSLNIYDSRGRKIKQLINNELLAASGSFVWDGSTEWNTIAHPGVYVIHFQCFAPEGKKINIKKTCVLAGKLNE